MFPTPIYAQFPKFQQNPNPVKKLKNFFFIFFQKSLNQCLQSISVQFFGKKLVKNCLMEEISHSSPLCGDSFVIILECFYQSFWLYFVFLTHCGLYTTGPIFGESTQFLLGGRSVNNFICSRYKQRVGFWAHYIKSHFSQG